MEQLRVQTLGEVGLRDPQLTPACEVERTDHGPIFIGGLANSGKTELRLILAAHPNLCFTRRTRMWTRYYNRFGDLAVPANLTRCLAQMGENKHIRALAPDMQRVCAEFSQGNASYARLFGLLHAHHAQRMGKKRWGDQLGFVEEYAHPIFAAFPAAKIVQMVRNPRHIYAEANTRSRQRPGKVGWLLADWLHTVHVANHNLRRYPGRYKLVAYEALMAQPEQVVSELLEFIGEDFVPEVFGKLRTLSPATSPATAKASEQGMSVRDVAFVQKYAREELLALGYLGKMQQLSKDDRLRYLAVEWPANRGAMVVRQAMHLRKAKANASTAD